MPRHTSAPGTESVCTTQEDTARSKVTKHVVNVPKTDVDEGYWDTPSSKAIPRTKQMERSRRGPSMALTQKDLTKKLAHFVQISTPQGGGAGQAVTLVHVSISLQTFVFDRAQPEATPPNRTSEPCRTASRWTV
ncbi:unnamed protein product [Chondrus crispus]|uniref:Uncharacterized protein n=1 Tax=Chondrus crispus TaxID=2769 RepID=R7QP03_CHOCR|nr:unnamed protein product [Chondrus crispus]CDF39115.1 unnamed protein product [Chondrus crispus]|eukprot:XP_005719026.1 unnamed protein product [Chondrus crispus]